MIRILFVIDSLTGGGAEAALVNLVNRLDHREFDLTVHTFQPGGEETLKPHIRFHCLNPGNSRRRFLWLRILAALGLPDLRDRYDLEIAYLECFPTKWLARPSRAAKIAWVHCRMDAKAGKHKMRRWYRRYDRVICVSEAVRTDFLTWFSGNTAVLPNVVPYEEILEKSREFPAESFDVLGIGRLSPEKGFDRLLTACRGLNAKVGILGEGPERTALEALAKDLGLDVTFLGFRGNPYPYMASAKLLAIPSRSEGCSTVAQEGLFLGKAMVAMPVPGMEALLGDAGLVTADLRAGLEMLLNQESARHLLEAKAARRGRELAAVDAVGRTETYFRELLREKGRMG